MHTPRPTLDNANWRASSYSTAQGNECVEVADGFPGIVPVRDSKVPDSATLVIPAAAWSAFVDSVRQ